MFILSQKELWVKYRSQPLPNLLTGIDVLFCDILDLEDILDLLLALKG